MYQGINVMMLIGFGFLMTFVKNHSWSALSYTFFINAVIIQLYLLLQPFWQKVFHGYWNEKIEIVEKNFTAASYSVAAVLISFGAVLGRVGPLELLIMGLVEIVGYTLNEAIVYGVIGVYDVGGSTAIQTFGAYFGLTVSLIIGKMVAPKTKPEASYHSNIFAMIGTLFLWMFWPSFNAGYYPTSAYERSLIIVNTIIAMTGSCLGTFIMTVLVR
jgi:ammonium transporter Rh